ncbi:PTS sugar transporter subunit IIA [Nordella sp. HKS 07]|uniref:PTS sugar transporter subunit IIA n=1 Tax=Nordella sp. HKS 07 TaxID=2712222 RepID=UPI0013E14D08|nr:PTS sugar transporter subunit IIA [Nordella sp. HKS 07]QIG48249.1 PTS sugar transporter subunit IIA [Nordella sp. HKS 07]
MRFVDLFQSDDIILDHPADTGPAVLEAVSTHLSARSGADMETIRAALTIREDVGSTAINHGVAIPHARLGCVTAPAATFMRLARPIDFDALDGHPVDLVFAMIWPAMPKEHSLIGLAELCRLLREPPLLHWLREAASPREARMLLCCTAEIIAARDARTRQRVPARFSRPQPMPA